MVFFKTLNHIFMSFLSDCTPNLPINYQQSCNVVTRTSGIKFLIFFKNGVTFDESTDPITDWENWQTKVANGDIIITPELATGEHPETDDTTEPISTCGTDAVVNETHSINGTVKKLDADEKDFTFFNTLKTNLYNYNVGWIGCDGLVYVGSNTSPGFTPNGKINHVQDENDGTFQRYVLNLTFKY